MPRKKLHTRYKNSEDIVVPSVTTIEQAVHGISFGMVISAVTLTKEGRDFKEVWDESKHIGTLSHFMMMQHYAGEEIKTEPYLKEFTGDQVDAAHNCMLSLFQWEATKGSIEPVLVEKPLVSDRLGFGGTPDLLLSIDDVPWLIDIKTGKDVYDNYYRQLGAYSILVREQGFTPQVYCILRLDQGENLSFDEHIIDNIKFWEKAFRIDLTSYKHMRRRGK